MTKVNSLAAFYRVLDAMAFLTKAHSERPDDDKGTIACKRKRKIMAAIKAARLPGLLRAMIHWFRPSKPDGIRALQVSLPSAITTSAAPFSFNYSIAGLFIKGRHNMHSLHSFVHSFILFESDNKAHRQQ